MRAQTLAALHGSASLQMPPPPNPLVKMSKEPDTKSIMIRLTKLRSNQTILSLDWNLNRLC